MFRYREGGLVITMARTFEASGIPDGPVEHASAESALPARKDRNLTELGDPEFCRHWSELRQRIALSGKTVPQDLKREYAAVSAEYRRRVSGARDS
jgi:hypothetical protein